MRALCGAIITAGALIGLGLTALAFGTRYGQTVGLDRTSDGEIVPQFCILSDEFGMMTFL